ncbi:MAG: hypothetical protein VB085_13525 [Peptococcaceae bacterium]|nr:hypothetical protein [Peptococcaceae bacterium]
MEKGKGPGPLDRRIVILLIVLAVLISAIAVSCYRNSFQDPLAEENQPVPGETAPPSEEGDGEEGPPAEEPEENPEEAKARDNEEVRKLLTKGQRLENFSYKALFTSSANEFSYEFYQRENLTKLVTLGEEGSQSVTISDGSSTVSYNLPEKTGFRMKGPADEMDIIPSISALLQDTYIYTTVGEEKVSGLDCRVVETEDEFGLLKLWISKTLGLPVKYLGTYDSGWYGLTLSDIQTGHADESLFVVPDDIEIINDQD